MVSNGSDSVGASKITGELLDIVIRMPQAMEQLTGVDITKVCLFYLYLALFLMSTYPPSNQSLLSKDVLSITSNV